MVLVLLWVSLGSAFILVPARRRDAFYRYKGAMCFVRLSSQCKHHKSSSSSLVCKDTEQAMVMTRSKARSMQKKLDPVKVPGISPSQSWDKGGSNGIEGDNRWGDNAAGDVCANDENSDENNRRGRHKDHPGDSDDKNEENGKDESEENDESDEEDGNDEKGDDGEEEGDEDALYIPPERQPSTCNAPHCKLGMVVPQASCCICKQPMHDACDVGECFHANEVTEMGGDRLLGLKSCSELCWAEEKSTKHLTRAKGNRPTRQPSESPHPTYLSTRTKTKNPTPQHSKLPHPTYVSENPSPSKSRGNNKKNGQSDSDIPKKSSAGSYNERKGSSAAVVNIEDVIEVDSELGSDDLFFEDGEVIPEKNRLAKHKISKMLNNMQIHELDITLYDVRPCTADLTTVRDPEHASRSVWKIRVEELAKSVARDSCWTPGIGSYAVTPVVTLPDQTETHIDAAGFLRGPSEILDGRHRKSVAMVLSANDRKWNHEVQNAKVMLWTRKDGTLFVLSRSWLFPDTSITRLPMLQSHLSRIRSTQQSVSAACSKMSRRFDYEKFPSELWLL